MPIESTSKTATDANTWWVLGGFAGALGLGGLWYWKTHQSPKTPVYVSLGGGSSSPGPSHTTTSTHTSAPVYHYTVKAGDTLSGIGFCTGSTVAQLQSMNHLSNPNFIRVGQVLVVPRPCAGSAETRATNGSSSGAVPHSPQLVIAGAQLSGGVG